MKKFIIFFGSILVVIAALYYTISTAVADKSTNPKFVTYEELSNILQPSLNVVWNEVDVINGKIDKIQTTLDQINERLDVIEAGTSSN